LDDAINEGDGRNRLNGLVNELEHYGYTTAARFLDSDLDALVVHLRYSLAHRRRWRSTNLLERPLAEVKRPKVIGRLPGESSCLTLVWAVHDIYLTHAKNGVRFNQLERQRLRRMRYESSQQTTDQEVTAA
jgi:transposase-like protein